MSQMNVDDLRNVLMHSNSAWNLKEALKRAIDIIDEKDVELQNYYEAQEYET